MRNKKREKRHRSTIYGILVTFELRNSKFLDWMLRKD